MCVVHRQGTHLGLEFTHPRFYAVCKDMAQINYMGLIFQYLVSLRARILVLLTFSFSTLRAFLPSPPTPSTSPAVIDNWRSLLWEKYSMGSKPRGQ